jgi:methylenetetrahydrofolate--tRNA-(uracil-5-)-methyltransferase
MKRKRRTQLSPIFSSVTVAGGGLAGSEAAMQLARRGVKVTLYEMRPRKMTPAHETGLMGEIVCSNSLGGDMPTSPAGILKAELRRLDSFIMECAEASRVPAGKALAVDREKFALLVDKNIAEHPNIEVIREELTEIPNEPVIIATGPLTSDAFAQKIKELVGGDFLYFFDAVAPIVSAESIDMRRAFRGGRYGRDYDYINCPMDEETYMEFWRELVAAERSVPHKFEEDEIKCFEGCVPIEELARRGEKTLAFGPMRPVGLEGGGEKKPYAVVQLRQDNEEGTLYNIVGFQTSLKWGEQERVFRLIPALKDAEFVRKGVMHKNLFVSAPAVLDGYLRPHGRSKTFFAGQITGVEGYVESTAMGAASAIFMYSVLAGEPMPDFPEETAIGSLLKYLREALPESFQPMNVNLGIFPKLPGKKIRKKPDRSLAYSERSLKELDLFINNNQRIFP